MERGETGRRASRTLDLRQRQFFEVRDQDFVRSPRSASRGLFAASHGAHVPTREDWADWRQGQGGGLYNRNLQAYRH